jgi:hypothetical protein
VASQGEVAFHLSRTASGASRDTKHRAACCEKIHGPSWVVFCTRLDTLIQCTAQGMLCPLRLRKPTCDVWTGDMGTIHGFEHSVGAMLQNNLGAPNKWRSSRTTNFQAASPETFNCLWNVNTQLLCNEYSLTSDSI